MKTDAAFFEIFEANPDRLEELTGLDLSKFCSASSEAQKSTFQVECDLLFKPKSPDDPECVVEIQMYFDHSIFNRTDMARAMIWKNRNRRKNCLLQRYKPKEVRGIIIFGDRSMLPPNTDRHSATDYLFLDELVDKLKLQNPNSPLIAVLSPLFQPDEELEKQAANHYGSLKDNENIHANEREILSDVFIHFISQRFKHLSTKEILQMIAELTPIEETQLGKELIEKGAEQTRRALAQNLKESGMTLQEIAKVMKLSVTEVKGLGISE